MSKCALILFAIALAVPGLVYAVLAADAIPPMTENLEWKGRIVVQFSEDLGSLEPVNDSGIALLGDAGLDALARQFNVFHMEMLIPGQQKPTDPRLIDLSRFYVLIFPLEIDLHEVAAAYAENPHIITAEPDVIRKCDYVPNDPYWGTLWHLQIVDAATAYNYSRGDSSVVVGIVDQGIDTAHADLRTNLWINRGEDLNHNGVIEPAEWNTLDDDANGYVDDFWGWNFYNGNNNVQEIPSDGHGSHTSGCATAVTDNGVGIASLGYSASVMAIKAGTGGFIYYSAAGINYCAQNGANVISLSYGGGWSSGENSAVQNAWNSGVAVFASAGNNGNEYAQYPAAFENVVAVASTGPNDQRSPFSNYGTWVDVCAPGENIFGTIPGSQYASWSGTSFSCPITAGLACLIQAARPAWTNAEIIQHIFETSVDIDSLNPDSLEGLLGWGRIDAGNALSTLFPNLSFVEMTYSDPSGNANGRPDPGETVEFLFGIYNASANWAANQVAVALTCEDPDVTILQGANSFTTIAAGDTVNNYANPMSFSVNSSAQPHEATFVLTLTEPTLIQPVVLELVQMLGRPEVIVVDDDGGANFQQWYDQDLDTLGVIHDLWDVNSRGEIPQSELTLYPTVIWHTSTVDSPLTAPEQALIEYYLSNGGRLFLTGEDIDEQLSETSFYSDVLHCTSPGSLGAPGLTGVDGDPISDGTTLLLIGGAGNSYSPSTIAPAGMAALAYTYTASGLGGGIHWDGANGMLVYFAFNFEAASGLGGNTQRSIVLNNILLWFNTFAVEEASLGELPTVYSLEQNYPNPFNPVSEISFALPKPDHVKLSVFDLTGRLVAVLANENLPAGLHKVRFQLHAQASGIYLYRFETKEHAFTRKMVLLK